MRPGRKPSTDRTRQRKTTAASAGQRRAMAPGPVPGQGPSGFGFGSRSVYLDRAVYTTITIMSVLIVYDGWKNLKFWAAVGVILGPVLAMSFRTSSQRSSPGKPSCTSVPATPSR